MRWLPRLRHHRAGFSFWADCWENASQGRPFDVETLDNNYYTPDEMAWSVHQALAYSDRYVWMWPGVIDWWGGTARTLDANGKEAKRPLPPAYREALRRAHDPALSAPPRERKPNTYRVLSARTQEGWSDEETFADLRQTHELLEDLPRAWRFRVDPDEVGVERGWHGAAFDDSAWETIETAEFWEVQGHSPYDGAAWYRLAYTPPALPHGPSIALAFGGVAEEAWVYVDGERVFASRFGESLRHTPFLVDLTGRVRSGTPCSIAVRVWNVGWCGGLWKSVKLVARAP